MRRYGAVFIEERDQVRDADVRDARVVRAREHRHRRPASSSRRSCRRRRRPSAPLPFLAHARADVLRGVLDVGDDVEPLRAVVGVQPRLAVAVEPRTFGSTNTKPASTNICAYAREARPSTGPRGRRGTSTTTGQGSAAHLAGRRTNIGIFVPSRAGYVSSVALRELRASTSGVSARATSSSFLRLPVVDDRRRRQLARRSR